MKWHLGLVGLGACALSNAAVAQCPPTVLDVRVVNTLAGPYSINMVSRAPITMVEGVSYTFNFPTGTGAVPSLHPFHLTRDADGCVGTTDAGVVLTSAELPGYTMGSHCATGCMFGSFTVTPGPQTPGNFYYQCSTHCNIGGTVTIIRRPVVTQAPIPVNSCRSGSAQFTIAATLAGNGSIAYQWRLNGVDLPGKTAPTLFVSPIAFADLGTYDCRVYNTACALAQTISPPANLTICPADLDDGSSAGVCDLGVDINDLIYFLTEFEQGSENADLDDDGLDPQQPDGGTDINDLIFMLNHLEQGC